MVRNTIKDVNDVPSFMKDALKKKDEAKLAQMQDEIKKATGAEEEEPEAAGPETESAEEVKAAEAESAEGSEAAEGQAEDLSAKVAELQDKLAEKEERILRLQADFENFRRRTVKEKEELSAVVTQGLLTDMLPILDNFERAMSAEATDAEAFRKGVDMIFTQFGEALAKNGLEHIEVAGRKFDPNFHQAVMRVENPELEDGTIAQELQKGYTAKGRVIRPSMVQVVANS